jgi:hypothetical protein
MIVTVVRMPMNASHSALAFACLSVLSFTLGGSPVCLVLFSKMSAALSALIFSFRSQAALSVWLLSAMHCNSSFQDLMNDAAPSFWSLRPMPLVSIPAPANLANSSSG